MSGYPNYSLKFDKSPPFYNTGENVTGFLLLETTKDSMVVYGIKLVLKGKAVSHYHSGRNTLKEKEVLIEKEIDLLNSDGQPPESFKKSLPIGNHTFPFSIPLPRTLPSTLMISPYEGYIQYHLEMKLAVKLKAGCIQIFPIPLQGEHTRRFPFTVYASPNVTSLPVWCDPVVVKKERSMHVFKGGGEVGYQFHLHKRGFVPGDVIKFHALLYNQSNKVIYTKVKLAQEIILGSRKGRLKFSSQILQKVKGPTLGPNETTEWNWSDKIEADDSYSPRLMIPHSAYVSESCGLICFVTYLKVEMGVMFGPWRRGFKDNIYIKLGVVTSDPNPESLLADTEQLTTDPWLNEEKKLKYLKLK